MGVSLALMAHSRVCWRGVMESGQERTSKEKPRSSQRASRALERWEAWRLSCLLQSTPLPSSQLEKGGLFIERAPGMELGCRTGHDWKM